MLLYLAKEASIDWQSFETQQSFAWNYETEWEVNQQDGKTFQMLHDLANDDGYVALKQVDEKRQVWRHRKDVKILLYSRRLLVMMMTIHTDTSTQLTQFVLTA